MKVKRIRKGELITAEFLNRLVDSVNANEISVDGSMRMYRGAGGTCLGVSERNEAIPFINSGSNDCPAYGVLSLADVTLDTGMPFYLTADRPSTTFKRFQIVNGSEAVAAGETGVGYIVNGSHNRLCIAAYDASATPVGGEEWGVKPGQFLLSKGYPGCFSVLGVLDSTNQWALGYLHPINEVFGKTSGAIAKNSTSGIVNVYSGIPGSGASIITSMSIPDVCNPWASLATGKVVGVNWRNGYPCIDAREC